MNITVFPDTGHHYREIPLAQLLKDWSKDELIDFVEANKGPFQPWDDFVHWVRYQYFLKMDENRDRIPTVRLAIETNLGSSSRGQVIEEDGGAYEKAPARETRVSPYAAEEIASIEEEYGKSRCLPLDQLPNREGQKIEIELNIYWPPAGGQDPVDVDLIVDLGNTRTVALLLETPGQDAQYAGLEKRIHILRFIPRGRPFTLPERTSFGSILDDDCAIIDSWLLLHRPLFAVNDPPLSEEKITEHYEPIREADGRITYRRQRKIPHAFVEISPALIGGGKDPEEGAASKLANVVLDSDARFFLSSPKRYVWDDEPVGRRGGTFWKQIPNRSDPDIPPDFFVELTGLFRYFMHQDGPEWDFNIDDPDIANANLPIPSSDPSYPRRDAVCWYALSILEFAQRQINAENYLRTAGRGSLPRRLRNIRVTFPAGWTAEEQAAYFQQWQRAINVFTMTRFEDTREVPLTYGLEGGYRPRLADGPLDEAVCSQLPVIYSDIMALGGNIDNWLELWGDGRRVVVMNLDIGGGTTDISVIEYTKGKAGRNGGGQRSAAEKQALADSKALNPRLLFRDGFTTAGDALVKRLIEKLILPAWLEAGGLEQYDRVPGAIRQIRNFFSDSGNREFILVDPKASLKMMRIIRLVLIPLANRLLQKFIRQYDVPDAVWDALDLSIVDPTVGEEMNTLCRKVVQTKLGSVGRHWEGEPFPFRDVRLDIDPKKIEDCIDEVFSEMFRSLGLICGRLNCHQVILSGKPSELPRIRELLEYHFPILPQRIVSMKNYPAGNWYPFSSFEEGRIQDAKTATVVGAALYQDIRNGNRTDLYISSEEEKPPSREYTWGILSPSEPEAFFGKNRLFSPADYQNAREYDGALRLEKTVTIPLNVRIGRQLVRLPGIRPEPVYELQFKSETGIYSGEVLAEVTLEWVSEKGSGEMLRLVDYELLGDDANVEGRVVLRLNTMESSSYWLDDPKLSVDFPVR